MTKPRLLDLFCGAGGAAMGYSRAGFDVIGVDIKPQKHYPFALIQGDALEYCAAHGQKYDVIHASPPCQRYSQAVSKLHRQKHADLISNVRQLLASLGVVYVIENVPTSPLVNFFTLCGSSFGLPIRRHRRFESNVYIPVSRCSHTEYRKQYGCAWNRSTPLRVLSISGGFQHGVTIDQYKAAMGITWDVTLAELSNAIPPAYTEYIGKFLIKALHD